MKNRFDKGEDVTVIYIERKNGSVYEVLVDTADFNTLQRLGDISWCLCDHGKNRGGLYAYYRVPKSKPQRNVNMHRLVTNAQPEDIIDHINGNTLDNRQSNLRKVDSLGNNHNRTRINRNNTSGTSGVAWHGQQNCWRAYIMLDRRQKHLGCFDSKQDAIDAAVTARALLFPLSKEAREYEALQEAV